MTGKLLVVGQNIDLDQFIGKLFIIEVAVWEKGSKVTSVRPKA